MRLAIFASCLALAAGAQCAQRDLQLFLLVGQSNMAGRGIVEPQDREVVPRMLVLTKSMEWAPAIDPLHYDKPAIAGVGLGRSFALALLSANPDVSIGLIPAAFGGTTLDQWQKGGELYEEAVRRTKIAMRSGRLRGILWHQGEGDSATEEKAGTYRDRFSRFIADLRRDLEAPDVPVVVGELGRFYVDAVPAAGKAPNHARLVNRQLEVITQTVPRIGLASSAGLKPKDDGVHFDSASLREFGARYARAFLALDPAWTSKPAKPEHPD